MIYPLLNATKSLELSLQHRLEYPGVDIQFDLVQDWTIKARTYEEVSELITFIEEQERSKGC